jgi:hypothetical protein
MKPYSKSTTSPESNVQPYEDLDSRQRRISGESFPEIALEVCDSCHWCLTCFNKRGVLKDCPVCGEPASIVPMEIDEVCTIESDEVSGLVMHFDRKNPLR